MLVSRQNMTTSRAANIVIVDDEITSVLILENAVQELGHVTYTTDPAEAVGLITDLQPDLVLMDIEMGDYNGVELCKKLKDNPHTANIAVIFVTAHDNPDIEFFSLDSGGIDFITKPINRKVCKLRVANQLALRHYAEDLEVAQRALFSEKEHFRATLNSIGDGVIATDAHGIVTFLNPIAQHMTGMTEAEAIGQHIENVMNLKDATTHHKSINPAVVALYEQRVVGMALNCQLYSHTGNIYRVEDSAAPIVDAHGNITGSIVVFHDISESIAMAVKMNHLANNDQLTGLPNRILLHDRLEQAIKVSQQNRLKTALMLVDIDNFKYLNDSLGHHIGDMLIKQVAKRLEFVMDANCTLARIGGDEFVLLVPNVKEVRQLNLIAADIQEIIQKPFVIDNQEYSLSVSVGISVNPTDAETEGHMMRNADVAMYRAKQQGKQQSCFFSQGLENDLNERMELEQVLREAIDKNSIEVVFQPQIDLASQQVIAAEALARLKGKDGDYIPPPKFISLAEELGLITKLGEQILRKSCFAAKDWYDQGKPIRVCVNVSALQFCSEGYFDQVFAVLEDTNLKTSLLELEVTESLLMQDVDLVEGILRDLSLTGIFIAIDDFGTGYSSLSYLKRLPVDVLKIDQSFVREMLDDKQSMDIVRTISDLGHSMQLKLVGEGIETAEHEQILKSFGCQMGQGYLYHKPLHKADFDRLVIQGALIS
ncbi:response regulator receiver modulated diguanylate cyclase/phosphodiesterase with PAS/PAC sensor(s) [Catenovulum agarivorans DS-2]|uniref:Response regulator receiver modulated diguanylate cyclase/phosphodiesterase with PAS/PAC sensor(S) n=1 Tax=Catenovulum agarivorans DS-2 TaxID=1328313 RepID=W7R2U1_9ALTE|nr:EAL domain-containing protein [Catenovulum agarivorans]EWH11955.1 response regulator receiver modulated diguanylate cyclase/phosphodiesterase with PAS/PAC sensor(s) [Catenovulum agarivorans DS-2]